MKTTKLDQLSACKEAIEYVRTQKSAKDAWMNCDRGDWLLWLAKRLNVDDRNLTLAKALCANQVRHLMKDQKSLDALDACFKYANGEITREELDVYAYAAYADAADAASATAASAAYAAYAASAAYADAAAAAAAAAAYAAYAAYAAAAAAAYYAYTAATAAAAAAYADTATATADATKMDSLKKSADICKEILTEDVLQKYKNLRYAKI